MHRAYGERGRGVRRLVVATVLVIGVGRGVGAAETNTVPVAEVALPELVVTGTRDARAWSEVPCSVGILDARDLFVGSAVRTVPEAFANEPGVMVQKTSQGQGSPYIRGFTGYRSLFLIDGVRLNNSVFRDGPNQYWNTVDPFSLRRIELVRGPSSVLYGSDAVGGTVNAITRGVQDLRPDSDWDRRLYYRYGSADSSHIVRAESIGRLTDELALTLGYTVKAFGDVDGGRDVGTQAKTGYDEMDWDAKLEYFIDEDAYLVLCHQSVDVDDAWRTHKTIYAIDWEGLSTGDELRRSLDQDRDLTYLQYHRRHAAGLVEEVHMGVSYQRQSEEQDRLRTGARHDEQGFDVGSVGAFVTLKSPSRLGTFIYGADVAHDEVNSHNRTLNPDGSVRSMAIQGPVGDAASYDLLGLFLQDALGLGERLSLILGVRYESARADADAVQDPDTGNRITVSGDWDNVAGSARALYRLDEDGVWNVYAGVSQSFRAPNLSDLTRFDSARTDEIETPAPDLDPEHFLSCEMGLKGGNARLSGQLAVFYTVIDGLIVRTPTGQVIDGDYEVTKRNAGDGHVEGVELEGRYCFWRELALFGEFTWMDGEVETYPTSDAVLVTEPIDRLMPPTGRVGLSWNRGGGYWVEGACRMAARADDLSTRDRSDTSRIPPGGTPGYAVFDVRAGWNCTRDFAVSLAVENVADEDYRIHGSGVNEPGRNVVLAADWTF